MSINIWTDSMQHAALLGKPVLFTNWLIQRDIAMIPSGTMILPSSPSLKQGGRPTEILPGVRVP